MRTIWVLGDQLNRRIGALADATPGRDRILFVESETKITSRRWHRQRLHLIVSAMRHFAAELRAEGFDVDYRITASMRTGIEQHRTEFSPSQSSPPIPTRARHNDSVTTSTSRQFSPISF